MNPAGAGAATSTSANLRALPLHGASLTTIDRHYGHFAREGREHAIKLLDALNAPELDLWTSVDARWTPKNGVKPDDSPEVAG
jgi:hypothetical protein